MPPEPADYGTRLALVEDRLETHTASTKEYLARLSEDVSKIAHAVVQQAEDRVALKRAFDQIERQAALLEKLQDRMDEMQRQKDKQEKDTLKEDLQNIKRMRMRAVGTIATAAILLFTSYIAWKMGIKLL